MEGRIAHSMKLEKKSTKEQLRLGIALVALITTPAMCLVSSKFEPLLRNADAHAQELHPSYEQSMQGNNTAVLQ